jgi:hypothetical protein
VRRDPQKPIIWFAVAVAVVLAAVLAVQLLTVPQPLKAIRSIVFSQSQAVPNFDTSSHTVESPTRIREFSALVKKYGVDVYDFDPSLDDGCTGGVATKMTLHFVDGSDQRLEVYACGGKAGTFVQDVTDLVTSWRTGG